MKYHSSKHFILCFREDGQHSCGPVTKAELKWPEYFCHMVLIAMSKERYVGSLHSNQICLVHALPLCVIDYSMYSFKDVIIYAQEIISCEGTLVKAVNFSCNLVPMLPIFLVFHVIICLNLELNALHKIYEELTMQCM